MIREAGQVKTRRMANRTNPEILEQITGALDWWRDAGVDCDYLDSPRQWLAAAEDPRAPGGPQQERARPAAVRPAEPAAPLPPSRFEAGALPGDLAAFHEWWLTEPLLDDGASGGRVLPTGPAAPKLMILVPEPEDADQDVLLSGPEGRLLDAILSAFSTARTECYLASALPRRTPAADWNAISARGMGDVLVHHVGLVAPERLIVLGGNVLPLLGHELPQRPAVLREFNHEGRTIPMLASRSLSVLLNRPAGKAHLWKAWLEWTTPNG